MKNPLTRLFRRFLLTISVSLSLAACADAEPGQYAGIATNWQPQTSMNAGYPLANAHISASDLVRNFRDITLSYEFYFANGRIVDRPLKKPLQRWRGTIKYRLIGDAVTPADAAEVDALMAELATLTGLRFSLTDGPADMLISIATSAGREAISRWLGDRGMTTYKERYDIWRRTPGWVCGATLASDRRQPGLLRQAHIFLAAEATGMRRSCLHEEIAQSLGLTNDIHAGPSIFNDDQRFAELTEHDRILLRTLYDPRLQPGMGEAEAMPLVAEIVTELVGVMPKR